MPASVASTAAGKRKGAIGVPGQGKAGSTTKTAASKPGAGGNKKRKTAEGTAAGPADEAGAATQQSRMQGAKCVCAACSRKPGANREWARRSASGSGEKDGQPIGDACMSCHERHQSGFGHLTWSEFVAHCSTAEGKQDLAELDSAANSKELPFVPDSVESQAIVRYSLQRSVIVLSASEYKKEMGKNGPGSRGPKVPVIKLPAEGSGEEVDHYCFLDPKEPHRKCIISTEMADVRSTHRLSAASNLFER